MIYNPRVILGLDPGTARIGYGLVASGTPPQLVACGILRVGKKERDERLFEAVTHLKELIKIYHPSLVALEKLFFVKNQKTGLQVSEMRGALLYAIHGENL